MSITAVAFDRQIVVLGTSQREHYFLASEGWHITETDRGVVLRREASQNRPEVPAFRVRGVGYSIVEEVAAVPMEVLMSRRLDSAPEVNGNGKRKR